MNPSLIELPNVTYRGLHHGETTSVAFQDDLCRVEGEFGTLLLKVENLDNELLLTSVDGVSCENLLLSALEYLFGHLTSLAKIQLHRELATRSPLLSGSFNWIADRLQVERAGFFQLSQLWLPQYSASPRPERWIQTNGRLHPERLDPRHGLVYSRYVPQTCKTLRFRVIDPRRDLATFVEWHNQPRVANFWELAKPEAEMREYIEKGLADPHQIPMILEIDKEPVGYFEMYWVAEDRLAPFCDHGPFDRGFHFLIGNPDFLGFKNTDAALKSVTHFLLLDDPRTRNLFAEPRSDNVNVLKYIETFNAWKKIKEFDFPHKRAALLQCPREVFFTGGFL